MQRIKGCAERTLTLGFQPPTRKEPGRLRTDGKGKSSVPFPFLTNFEGRGAGGG